MKKFHISAYRRAYGATHVFSETITAPSAKDAKIEFSRRHWSSWITSITEL